MKKRLLSAILSVVMIAGMIPLCTAPVSAEEEAASVVLAFDAGNIQPDGSYLFEDNRLRITGGHADSEHGGIYAGSAEQWLTIEALYPTTITITDVEAEITYWGGWYNLVGISGGTKVEETAETGSTVKVTGINSDTFSFAGGTDYCAFGNITVYYTVDGHEHDFSAYVINGDGTHSKKCTCCGKIGETAAHTFVDYVCSACGAEDMTGVKADATAAIQNATKTGINDEIASTAIALISSEGSDAPATVADVLAIRDQALLDMAKADAAAEINAAKNKENEDIALAALTDIENAASITEVNSVKDTALGRMQEADAALAALKDAAIEAIDCAKTTANADIALNAITNIHIAETTDEVNKLKAAALFNMAKADAVAEINAATTTANSTAAADAITAIGNATTDDAITAAKNAGLLAMAKLDAVAEINAATTTANSTAAGEAAAAVNAATSIENVTAAKDAGLLAMAKLDAVAEINTATTTENSTAAEEATDAVNAATSIDDVHAAKDAGLLAMTKLDAKASVNAAKNAENEAIAMQALTNIDNAASITEVNSVKDTALGLMQEADAALAALKAAAIAEIENAQTEVNAEIANTAKTNINDAETTAEVNGLKADALLGMAKADAVAAINAATTAENGAAVAEAITAIDAAATVEAVHAARDAGLLAMTKLDAKASVNAAKNAENEAIAMQALTDIDNAASITEVNTVKDTALGLMQEADAALAALKTAAIAEIEGAQTEANAEIANIAKTNIAGAETTDAVNELKAAALLAMAKLDAKAAVNAAKNAENGAIALQALTDIDNAASITEVNTVKNTALGLMQEADAALAALKTAAIAEIEDAQTAVNAEIADTAKTNIAGAETTDAVNGLKAAALLAMAKADAAAEINAAKNAENEAIAQQALDDIDNAASIAEVNTVKNTALVLMQEADAALAALKASALAEIEAAQTEVNAEIANTAKTNITNAETTDAVNGLKAAALLAMAKADAAAVIHAAPATEANAAAAEAALTAIDEAATVEAVIAARDAGLLAMAKADAIAEINAVKKPDNTQIAEDAITAIGNAGTVDAIEPILTAALAEMDAVHAYIGLATDNGDGTHTVRCLTCDKSVTEPHTLTEHDCPICGYGDARGYYNHIAEESQKQNTEYFNFNFRSWSRGVGHQVGSSDYYFRITAKDPHYMITRVEFTITRRENNFSGVDVSSGRSFRDGNIGYVVGVNAPELVIGSGDSTDYCLIDDIYVYYVIHDEDTVGLNNGDGTHKVLCSVCGRDYGVSVRHNAYSAETGRCACGEACIHTFDKNGICTTCRCSIDSAAALEENIAYALTRIDEKTVSDNSDIAQTAKTAIGNAKTLRELTELLEEYLSAMEGAHVFGACTDNHDGTHSRVCSVCQKVFTEPHTEAYGHVCTLCGAAENMEFIPAVQQGAAFSIEASNIASDHYSVGSRPYVKIKAKNPNYVITHVKALVSDTGWFMQSVDVSCGTKGRSGSYALVDNVNASELSIGGGGKYAATYCDVTDLYVYYQIHDYSGEYVIDNASTHSRVCLYCDRIGGSETHSFTKYGVCRQCDAYCDHNWNLDWNGGICRICGCMNTDPDAVEIAKQYAIAAIEAATVPANESIAQLALGALSEGETVEAVSAMKDQALADMAQIVKAKQDAVAAIDAATYFDNEDLAPQAKDEITAAETKAAVDALLQQWLDAMEDRHIYTGICTDNYDGTHSFHCSVCDKLSAPEAHTTQKHVCTFCGSLGCRETIVSKYTARENEHFKWTVSSHGGYGDTDDTFYSVGSGSPVTYTIKIPSATITRVEAPEVDFTKLAFSSGKVSKDGNTVIDGIDSPSVTIGGEGSANYYSVTRVTLSYTLHDYNGGIVNNGDGTHSVVCTECGRPSEASTAHTFENGICECGETCTHNFENGVCTICHCVDNGAEDVAQYRAIFIENINTLKNEQNAAIAEAAIADLENAQTVTALTEIRDRAIADMTASDAVLESAKAAAEAEISEAVTDVNAPVAEAAIRDIRFAKTAAQVNTILATALLDMAKADAVDAIEKVIRSDNEMIAEEALRDIDSAETVEEVSEKLAEWLVEMEGIHDYGTEYTDNGDGTHSRFCTSCGKELIEAHVCTNHVCTLCDSRGIREEMTYNESYSGYKETDRIKVKTNNFDYFGYGKAVGENGLCYVEFTLKDPTALITRVDVVLGESPMNWNTVGVSSGTKLPAKNPAQGDTVRIEDVNANTLRIGTANGNSSCTHIADVTIYYVNHDYTGECLDNYDGTHSHRCIGCDMRGTPLAHTFGVYGVCTECGALCNHVWDDGVCTVCGCTNFDPEAVEATRAGAIALINAERTDVNTGIADETIAQINTSVSVMGISSCTEAGRIRMAKADVAAELNARKAAAKCDEAKAFLDEVLAYLDEAETLLDVNTLRLEALAEADGLDQEYTDLKEEYMDVYESFAADVDDDFGLSQMTLDLLARAMELLEAAPSIEALNAIRNVYNDDVLYFCSDHDWYIYNFGGFIKYAEDAPPAQIAYARAAMSEIENMKISDYTDSTTGDIDVAGLYNELYRIDDYYWRRIYFYDDKQETLGMLLENMEEEGMTELYYEITEEYIGLVEALNDPEEADELAILGIKYAMLSDIETEYSWLLENWDEFFGYEYCEEMEEYVEKTFDLIRQYTDGLLAEAEESGYTYDDYFELYVWYSDYERDDNYVDFLYFERIDTLVELVWKLYAEDGTYADASETLRSLLEEKLEALDNAVTQEAFEAVLDEYEPKIELAVYKEEACKDLWSYPESEYGIPAAGLSNAVKAIIENGCTNIWSRMSERAVDNIYYATCALIDEQLESAESDIVEIKQTIGEKMGEMYCLEAYTVLEDLLKAIAAAEDEDDDEELARLISQDNLEAVFDEALAIDDEYLDKLDDYKTGLEALRPEDPPEDEDLEYEMNEIFRLARHKLTECYVLADLDSVYEECRNDITFGLARLDIMGYFFFVMDEYSDTLVQRIAGEAVDAVYEMENGNVEELLAIYEEYDAKLDVATKTPEKVIYAPNLIKAPTVRKYGLYNIKAYYIDDSGKEIILCDGIYYDDYSVTFADWYLRTSIQYKETGDGGVNVRFVSMLDKNLGSYYEAGFTYMVDGEDSFDPLTTQLGKTSYVVDGETVKAGDFGLGEKYFILRDIDFAKEAVDADLDITVTPYVLLADRRTYITGDSVTFNLGALMEAEEDEEAA